ncbi:MAG TPA: glycosyltransferase family 61 protein [Planctomycetaceae bacterium]|nr:glycosyltransferase family 61 protein [Planctomycetaceae bacterium]
MHRPKPTEPRFEILQPAALAEWTRPVSDRAELLHPGGRGRGIELTPARTLRCDPPKNLVDPNFFFSGPNRSIVEYTVGPQRVDALSDALIIGPKAVVAAGGRVFQETYWSDANLDDGVRFKRIRLKMQMSPMGDAVTLNPALCRIPVEPLPRWSEAAVLLAQPWAHNWHHWLLDSLTRLMLIADWPEFAALPVIVPGELTKPQADSLRALGIDDARWRRLAHDVHEVATLIIPQPGGFAPEILQRLRSALGGSGGSGRKHLYISRSDAPTRRVTNEAEVLAALQPYDVQCVTLSGLSFAEQRALFAEAGFIIGPHGAGLTNSLFSHGTAHVIELHPDDNANGCFRLTTAAWHQSHDFLTGPVVDPQTRDFRIDPAVVRRAVEGWLV